MRSCSAEAEPLLNLSPRPSKLSAIGSECNGDFSTFIANHTCSVRVGGLPSDVNLLLHLSNNRSRFVLDLNRKVPVDFLFGFQRFPDFRHLLVGQPKCR